jgi:alpha,alpha-trehalose phosphorylase
MTPRHEEAVLFDLDGVLTSTASLHARCWKQVFDELLAEHSRESGQPQSPFDPERDYLAHVDGRTRDDGVRAFLESRGIELPERLVHGVGNRKQALVEKALRVEPAEAYPGSVRWVRELRAAGVRTAVVSSSTNCRQVLRAAGIANLFELTVDGRDISTAGLRGKPAPDAFLEAARRLGLPAERATVVEDAVAGVAAGRAGAFGLVIGVARSASHEELRSAGADVVVGDLEELCNGAA